MPTFEELDKLTDKQETALTKALIKAYSTSLKETRSKIALAYEKYSNDGILDYAAMQKYNRLALLEKSITDELVKLYATLGKTYLSTLQDIYLFNYFYTGWIFENDLQTNIAYAMLPDESIKKAILSPLSGLTLNQRIGKNREIVITKIKEQLTQGLIQGESIQKMGARIKSVYETDTNNALRIAQTETTRIRNAGKNESYKKAASKGVRFTKVWMSTLDSKTRDNHKKLDGMKANKDGYFVIGRYKAEHPGGFGVAEMDINCRCTTRAQLEGIEPSKRKDNESKMIIDYKNYDDWYKERVSK